MSNKDFYLYIDNKYNIHIPAISFEFGLDSQFSVSELSFVFNINDVINIPHNILYIDDISIESDDFFVEKCIISNIKYLSENEIEYNLELLDRFITDPVEMDLYSKSVKRNIKLNKIKKQ